MQMDQMYVTERQKVSKNGEVCDRFVIIVPVNELGRIAKVADDWEATLAVETGEATVTITVKRREKTKEIRSDFVRRTLCDLCNKSNSSPETPVRPQSRRTVNPKRWRR